MPTLIVRNDGPDARQFLAFAQTLPYVDVIEDITKHKKSTLKKSVINTLRKTEQGEDLVVCKNVDEMFEQLGI